ncbi:MAG: pseudouridine synthase [Candidatus Puniceispirillaceae bacterium]
MSKDLSKKTAADDTTFDGERIAKRIARAGVCSRREAEKLIADGKVSVNGTIITSPALNVDETAKIVVDGKQLAAPDQARLWRYYKPRGLVVSARDEKGRETVFDALPETLGRVISVGRLDIDSEGLLLLTNDGDLARHLELPATGWSRRYKVRVQGRVDEARLEALKEGITIDGVRYGEIDAVLETQMPSNAWLTIAIKEGKNREVRRIMEHLGHLVSRLIRLSYGPFQLGRLEKGEVEEVRAAVLREQLGLEGSKSEQAGKSDRHYKVEYARPEGGRAKPRNITPKGKNKNKPTLKLAPKGASAGGAKGAKGAKNADHRRPKKRR